MGSRGCAHPTLRPCSAAVRPSLVISGTQDGLLTVRPFLDAARGGLYIEPNEVDVGLTRYAEADIVFS